MTIMLLAILCGVLAVWVGIAQDEAKKARQRERDMGDAIAAEDGTVLELLAKYGGEIRHGYYGSNGKWNVTVGVFRVDDHSLADAWKKCTTYIRAQEAVEAEKR